MTSFPQFTLSSLALRKHILKKRRWNAINIQNGHPWLLLESDIFVKSDLGNSLIHSPSHLPGIFLLPLAARPKAPPWGVKGRHELGGQKVGVSESPQSFILWHMRLTTKNFFGFQYCYRLIRCFISLVSTCLSFPLGSLFCLQYC